jgi:hypothetical protein
MLVSMDHYYYYYYYHYLLLLLLLLLLLERGNQKLTTYLKKNNRFMVREQKETFNVYGLVIFYLRRRKMYQFARPTTTTRQERD